MTGWPRPQWYVQRPRITPELVERFAAYFGRHPAWGALHVVLDEANYGRCEGLAAAAARQGDAEGAALARILHAMSKSQQGRVAARAMRRGARR